MRVLVCGGRDYGNWGYLYATLNDIDSIYGITEIIHGGATGADKLAGRYAELTTKACKVFSADWNKHGKKAGYLRNKQMLEEGQPDLVVAFPGGKGTQNMIDIAKKAGVEVKQYGND